MMVPTAAPKIDNTKARRKTKRVTLSLLRASSLLVILFVLLLFLFPVATGPYSACHGPATAMRASRAAKFIFWVLILCGCSLFRRCTGFIANAISRVPLSSLRASFQPLSSIVSLRC